MTNPTPNAELQAPSSNAQFIPLDRIGSVLTTQILSLPAIRSSRKRKTAKARAVRRYEKWMAYKFGKD